MALIKDTNGRPAALAVRLNAVSLRFPEIHERRRGLKEAILRMLSPQRHWTPDPEDAPGLHGVSLVLGEGDRLGVIGRNGAGKSTLLKLLSRIYAPTSGGLTVNGRVAAIIELGAGFCDDLTGRENALLYGAILGFSRREMLARLPSVVEFAELEEFMDAPVKYYSTGMVLRLAFTLATEVAPDILVLDELFAGGDAAFVVRANMRLDDFIRRSRVLVLVSHDMNSIRRFCNRVIVLDHGRIVADGDPEPTIGLYERSCREGSGVWESRRDEARAAARGPATTRS
jgi:ABC-type polysaccharide/polyol phosphate transport system ATPase subunit